MAALATASRWIGIQMTSQSHFRLVLPRISRTNRAHPPHFRPMSKCRCAKRLSGRSVCWACVEPNRRRASWVLANQHSAIEWSLLGVYGKSLGFSGSTGFCRLQHGTHQLPFSSRNPQNSNKIPRPISCAHR